MNKILKKVLVIGLPVFVISMVLSQLIIRADTPKPTPTGSTASVIAPPTSQEVETAINKFRADNGLPALTDNAVLDQAAQVRADTMCAENDWSHDKAWQVLDQYYQYAKASENLHYDFLQKDQANNAVYGWAHSPGHRETMLADNKELGIGVKYCPGYQGRPTAVLITSYYGIPR